jgi:sterol 3beta-glucosyltransferase
MATEDRLKSLVDEFDLPWRRLEGDHAGLLLEPAAQQALRDGSLVRLMRLTKEWEARFNKRAMLESFERAADGCDIVIASALCLAEGLTVAQARGAAFISLIPGPTWPTAAFPLWALPVPCSCLYRWSYTVAFAALLRQEKVAIEPWRASLGLAPLSDGLIGELSRLRAPTLVAASQLTCGPERRTPADYPPFVHVGGFLFAAEDQHTAAADAELAAFSAGGWGADGWVVPRPDASASASLPLVYFGFGSMPALLPLQLMRLVVDTCAAAGCRAVLVAGWSELESDPACVELASAARAAGTLVLRKTVHHGVLFPRCAAIVHHCGIGTFAASLRSGKPQLPCPFMLDQPHTAKLALRLGVAPAVVPFDRRITAAKLAGPLRSILAERGRGKLSETAQLIGELVRSESAHTESAFVEVIERAQPAGVPPASVVVRTPKA